ncbi:MAG: hypothetical protein M3063_06745 [Actinomycetota bacterium]|nr:hypothetical protein [Actinomycetota bacterium]MDQ6948236.1 hypothetical protein [Actinomycetota bacterium]
MNRLPADGETLGPRSSWACDEERCRILNRSRFRIARSSAGLATSSTSALDPPGDDLDWSGRAGAGRAGFAGPSLVASYVHVHMGSVAALTEPFVAAGAGQQ